MILRGHRVQRRSRRFPPIRHLLRRDFPPREYWRSWYAIWSTEVSYRAFCEAVARSKL